jgi:hypothetical protein
VSVPAVCSSCGEELHGRFCSHCGQAAEDLNQPLGKLLRTWLEMLVAFDSKIWRTLKPLLLRPGFLTQEYVAGRRVQYVHPLKLYLFMSFVVFVVLGLSGYSVVRVNLDDDTDGATVVAPIVAEGPAQASDDAPHGGWRTAFNRELEDLVKDPQALNATFVRQLPKALFVLVPVFAALLKLAYLRHGILYVQHLVLTLHLHAFIAVVMVIGMVARMVTGSELASNLVPLAAIVYLYLALRRVYARGRLGTAFTVVALWIGYSVALVIAIVSTLATIVLVRVLI